MSINIASKNIFRWREGDCAGRLHVDAWGAKRYVGVPLPVHTLFSIIFPVIFEWFQLYRIVVTSCIVHCVTCFLYINLRVYFSEKIKKNDPKITLHAKRNTYEEEEADQGLDCDFSQFYGEILPKYDLFMSLFLSVNFIILISM